MTHDSLKLYVDSIPFMKGITINEKNYETKKKNVCIIVSIRSIKAVAVESGFHEVANYKMMEYIDSV